MRTYYKRVPPRLQQTRHRFYEQLDVLRTIVRDPRVRGRAIFVVGDFRVEVPGSIEGVSGSWCLGRSLTSTMYTRAQELVAILQEAKICLANAYPSEGEGSYSVRVNLDLGFLQRRVAT